MVLYFTGTGNSRYLARRIAEGLEMPLYDLNAYIKAGDTAPVQTGRDVVLVTPTYAWRIPRVVSGWLGKTALTGAERIWFVMDCGSEIGNAAGYNRQLAAQKHLHYMGTAQIIMPENYIAMFNAPQKEQARSIVEQAEPELQKVLTRLKAGQEFPPPRENLYDRLMSGPVNPVFYRFFVKADAFRATDACIGCGHCKSAGCCVFNDDQVNEAAAKLREADGPVTVVGDGWKLCVDFLTERGIPCAAAAAHLRLQSAVGVAMAAERLGPEALVSAQRLGRLAAHTRRVLEDVGRELAAGNIAADPFWRGPDHNACQWCEYAAACHFEEGRGGDRRRFLPAVRGEEFWQAVAKEQV